MLERLKSRGFAVVWAIVRIWLGVQWMKWGLEKFTAGGFDATAFLNGAVRKSLGDFPSVPGWYASFLKGFALPHVDFFNLLVSYGEVLVAISLILGALTTVGLVAALLMNLSFMLAASTYPNPLLYSIAIVLLIMGPAAYEFGVDRYMLPILKRILAQFRARSPKRAPEAVPERTP